MTTVLQHIKDAQIKWAVAHGKAFDAAGYTPRLEDNLFCPLSDSSREDFRNGKGGELGKEGGRPKLCALHSSAALAVNVFEYWRNKDPSPLASACGLTGTTTGIRFEAIHPNRLGRIPSHLDVEFHAETPLAIESKFTEPYSRHTQREIASSYLNVRGLWDELPGCKALAERIKAEEKKRTSFEYLDVPQMIKHLLALHTSYPQGFTLLYLWYGVDSPEAQQHQREITEFESFIKNEVDFRVMTYQSLFSRIRKIAGINSAYIGYLAERYFSEGVQS
jgi:hypothetical protein